MIEIELKAVLDNWEMRRKKIESAGAKLVFEGSLEDTRYDTKDKDLKSKDHGLRLRIYRNAKKVRATLDWKGPAKRVDGYKQREELNCPVDDADSLAEMLDKLGYVVTEKIDREIVQYTIHGATVRFEHYPRMDDLIEVEGEPDDIESAIKALGIPRGEFTDEKLSDFVKQYEARTDKEAALSKEDLKKG